ncbi:MAG: hypothetical protein COW24_02350 [Candidatus Kerfeldbacteria bacterium CG15_BIG_FIL_POST_REV_8_21_14_020_45_12]|uniref:DUF3566 domain-containing protein n=1 Tax=Candidatus Kerfeldbacteria bacterium CG15_BIG_FIL_POST_REV_8_21_14_020_45_12 TaxID=2014247 RepID=A0A2M7H465_9BACT|nr:MAG: hypothetical protein COW24_02350 [Candidatus Kerfeldbacteria bacterium CG15_BIG_FIL_POST_REV_8_21_14_020_45_12]PJA93562.1 MAG: hypothetical protein CO132_02390 [Candidatus Kerfeldbacteria bacterium CG_4_9_14_3_um_filter_45_8]
MYEITHINAWIPARYVGIVVAIIALIPGVLAYIDQLHSLAGDELVEELGYIIVPLVIGLAAYVATGVSLMVYNKISEQFGGLKLDLEFVEEEEPVNQE